MMCYKPKLVFGYKHRGLRSNSSDVQLTVKNPASLAKLLLNSARGKPGTEIMISSMGKFCGIPAREETEIFDLGDAVGQANFMDHAEYETTSLKDIDGITMISRMKIDAYLDTKNYANIVFGVITTAVARLQLYTPMKIVGLQRLIYCDTDSVVFEEMAGENLVDALVGTGLEKLESEVPAGWSITKFVAIAPKCYAYELCRGETNEDIVKVRGVDATNSNIVGEMERMAREMIGEQYAEPIFAKARGMKKSLLVSISNYETLKMVQPVVDKLRLCLDGSTQPYGYRNSELINDYLFE